MLSNPEIVALIDKLGPFCTDDVRQQVACTLCHQRDNKSITNWIGFTIWCAHKHLIQSEHKDSRYIFGYTPEVETYDLDEQVNARLILKRVMDTVEGRKLYKHVVEGQPYARRADGPEARRRLKWKLGLI